ncbi:MAG: porin [Melioribacteraceae bacterium]
MKNYYTLVIILLFFYSVSNAQNSGPSLSGYFETTYNYNFANGKTNMLRSYDSRANQIALNNLHLELSGNASDKLSYNAQIDFGTDAAVHGVLHQSALGAGPVAVDLQEAYLTYSFNDQWKFTVGKFVTFEGIEVIEGPYNPTISRGYLFGLAEPFTHVGGYINFIPSPQLDFKLGVINGWDLLVDNNLDKTIIARLGINLGEPLSFGISYSYGVEQLNSSDARNSFDLTGVTNLIPNIAVNFQFNYGLEKINNEDTKWMGFGIQPVIKLSEGFDVGLRAEYFSDEQGARTGITDLKTFNFTVVPTFKLDALTLRVEYRLDNANQEIFIEENGVSKISNTISLGLSFSF